MGAVRVAGQTGRDCGVGLVQHGRDAPVGHVWPYWIMPARYMPPATHRMNHTFTALLRFAIALMMPLVFSEGARAQDQHVRPATTTAVLTVEGMQADIAAFRDDFFESDIAYTPEARAGAEGRLADLEVRLDNVSPAQFELRLAQIVSLADNGHTISFAHSRAGRYNRIPIRMAVFGEDYYVLRAVGPHADVLGAKVVSVGGTDIAEIRDAARALAGGTVAHRDRAAPFLIESPEQLYALGLVPAPTHATYVFERSNGERIEQILGGGPGTTGPGGGDRLYYPEIMDGETDEWQRVLDVEDAPWALQDPDDSFRSMDLLDLDAIIIELRRNYDGPDQTMRAAIAEFRQAIEGAGRTNLVLDMRQNGGGDLNTTRDFMEALPDMVSGHVFVLISPWTFSAAISSVGYLKQTAPERVTIVGEGPGDRLEFFAEGGVTILPNSGAMLLAATERHDYRTGCEGFSDCHGSVVRHPIAVESLGPVIAAPWTFEAYAAGSDPGMEAVAHALAGE